MDKFIIGVLAICAWITADYTLNTLFGYPLITYTFGAGGILAALSVAAYAFGEAITELWGMYRDR